MVPDPAASKPGLMDRRFNFRVYWVDDTELKRQWPDALALSVSESENTGVGVIRRNERYDDEQNSTDEKDRHKDQTQIRLYECYETEPVFRVAQGNEVVELSASEFAKNKDQIEATGT